MNRKVLVTGGAGFIGSHVADAFLAAGDRVWIVDDLSTGKRANLPADAEFVECDIRSATVVDLFRDVGGFDVVSHHAAQMDVRVSVNDPRYDAAINIDGFLNLTEAAIRYGTGRFIFVSSGGVAYGERQMNLTPETAPKLPLSPYGITKLTAEYYLYYYRAVHGLEYATLRYGNVYGPRQDPHGEAGVVAIFCNRILRGEPPIVFGDGGQTRDYIFIDDAAAANIAVANAVSLDYSTFDGPAFNVGSGAGTSVNEIGQLLLEAAGSDVGIDYAPERKGELRHTPQLATDKLQALRWRQSVTLRDGLAMTYQFLAGEK